MAYVTLPMPKKNSVKTTLSSGISAIDTTIPVAELSMFYDKDGALITKGIVLGFLNADDTLAEEITITGASGTSGAGNLTGASRGVNADGSIGAGHAWDAGTDIAVMLSTGVSLQIRENFEALNTEASTTAAGQAPQANAPASGIRNVVCIDNGETAYKNAALFDNTNPEPTGSASPGTSLIAARRDHIHAGGGGVVFSSISGTTQQAAVNNGYIPLNAALTTITLPATAAVGDVVAITGYGAGLWKLAQNASQLIQFLSLVTTTGTGGYIQATTRYDTIIVRCVVENTTWVVENAVGNLDVI